MAVSNATMNLSEKPEWDTIRHTFFQGEKTVQKCIFHQTETEYKSIHKGETLMERHLLIISAEYKVKEGRPGCTSLPGSVYAEAGFRRPDGEEFYITCREMACTPAFYKSSRSIIEELVLAEEDLQKADPAFLDYICECCMEGIGRYNDIFSKKDPEWFDILRYVIYIIDSDFEESDDFIEKTVGKYLDEIDIPASEVEGIDPF